MIPEHLATLPGADILEAGLADLAAGRKSIPALLVAIGAPRLRWLGVPVPETAWLADPERQLYLLLEAEDAPAAHSAYNAWVRRLVRFENALEHEVFRRRRRTIAPS